ncbi:MAG: hypothetical protein JO362_09185 [Streptomycetaceae bacterium]|nr:hypothetical protein [Streptomycetaceae bacterium]
MPGDPQVLQGIVDDFTYLRDTAWSVSQGLDAFVASASGGLEGAAADALREVVSGRLKTFVSSIVRAFSLAGEAVAEYRNTLVQAQQVAADASAKAEGMGAGDPKLAGLKSQVQDQMGQVNAAAQAMEAALRDAADMVSQPVKVPSLWDRIRRKVELALSIVAGALALLSVPFDGPIGVALAAAAWTAGATGFAMTAVDVARHQATWKDLLLASLGFLVPGGRGMFGMEALGAAARAVVNGAAEAGQVMRSPALLAGFMAKAVPASVRGMADAATAVGRGLVLLPGAVGRGVMALPSVLKGTPAFLREAWASVSPTLAEDFAHVVKWYPRLVAASEVLGLGKAGAYAVVNLGRVAGVLFTPLRFGEMATLGFRGAWVPLREAADWSKGLAAFRAGYAGYTRLEGIGKGLAAAGLHELGDLSSHDGDAGLHEPQLTPVSTWTARELGHEEFRRSDSGLFVSETRSGEHGLETSGAQVVSPRETGGSTVSDGPLDAVHSFSQEQAFEFRTVPLPGTPWQLRFETATGLDGPIRVARLDGTPLAAYEHGVDIVRETPGQLTVRVRMPHANGVPRTVTWHLSPVGMDREMPLSRESIASLSELTPREHLNPRGQATERSLIEDSGSGTQAFEPLQAGSLPHVLGESASRFERAGGELPQPAPDRFAGQTLEATRAGELLADIGSRASEADRASGAVPAGRAELRAGADEELRADIPAADREPRRVLDLLNARAADPGEVQPSAARVAQAAPVARVVRRSRLEPVNDLSRRFSIRRYTGDRALLERVEYTSDRARLERLAGGGPDDPLSIHPHTGSLVNRWRPERPWWEPIDDNYEEYEPHWPPPPRWSPVPDWHAPHAHYSNDEEERVYVFGPRAEMHRNERTEAGPSRMECPLPSASSSSSDHEAASSQTYHSAPEPQHNHGYGGHDFGPRAPRRPYDHAPQPVYADDYGWHARPLRRRRNACQDYLFGVYIVVGFIFFLGFMEALLDDLTYPRWGRRCGWGWGGRCWPGGRMYGGCNPWMGC